MPEVHDPYAALRHGDYRLLLAGGVLASIGGEIQAVAVGWELYQRHRTRAAALGLAGLAQFLPVLLLALPAGQAADRYSRKLLFQAGARAWPPSHRWGWRPCRSWQGRVELIFCLPAAGGRRPGFSAPSRSSLLPQVVPPETLHNAVTWNSSGWQFANVAGPALGGGCWRWPAARRRPAYLLAALLPRPAWSCSPRPAPLAEPAAAGTAVAGLAARRRALRLADGAAAGGHHARPVRRAAGRRDGAAADLRQRHPASRRRRPGLAAGRPGPRRDGDGGVAGPPAAVATAGTVAAAGGGRASALATIVFGLSTAISGCRSPCWP